MAASAIPVARGPAASRFGGLFSSREPFLVRARRCSRLTIPGLYREMGENETTSETLPWQSLGAYGVNNLAAKLTMALFPTGIPFINLKQTKAALQGLAALDPDARGKLKAEIDKGLSGVEQEFMDGVVEDGDGWRLFDSIRHLIVGGNHCLHIQKDATLKSIPLEQYVTVRDASGNLMDAVIEDALAWESLPEDVQQLCQEAGYEVQYQEGGNGEPNPVQQPVRLYTRVWRQGQATEGAKFNVYQECWGRRVPGTEATYNEDALPYLFLRMVALKKENYGRSYVEDYEGDLQTLDGYWQLLTEGSASIAQAKWLVKPGGVTNKKQFAELPNGGVMTGDPEDVAMVRSEKQADLQVAENMADKLEARLERVFVIAQRRDGERVTAEEIRQDAQELEKTLGGVYANQVTTFQAPYAGLKLAALQRNGRVTQLPKGTTKLSILTGDAGLGRMQKAQTLDEFMDTVSKIATSMGQSPIEAYIDWGTYLSRGAANRSIDPDGLIKSQDQVDAAQAQTQQQQNLANVAPELVKQGGAMVQASQQAALSGATPGAPPQAAPAPAQPGAQ